MTITTHKRIMPLQRYEASSAGRQWRCPHPTCAVGVWFVQPSPAYREVWQISALTDEGSWTVAATKPICPLDGRVLELVP